MSDDLISEEPIRDENIIDLNKNLKNNKFSVEDLFKEEE